MSHLFLLLDCFWIVLLSLTVVLQPATLGQAENLLDDYALVERKAVEVGIAVDQWVGRYAFGILGKK